MDYPAISQLRAYWEALRDGRSVPARSEIDPRGIEGALEYAFILERLAPRVARFRLAGTHLSDLIGMEVRGMPITTFFTPSSRDRIADHLEQVFMGPAIVELNLKAEAGLGKPPADARLLILPLKSDVGDVTRAIGCLVTRGTVGRAPRRFDLVKAQITEINGRTPASAAPDLISGFAEASAVYAHRPAISARKRGHLRLVKSDE